MVFITIGMVSMVFTTIGMVLERYNNSYGITIVSIIGTTCWLFIGTTKVFIR